MYFGPPPQILQTEVFATLPESLAKGPGGKRAGFLEGPSFDRDGNLLCVDIQAGRVYRISPDGAWDVVVEYDGTPNGLKLHRDGHAFIADRKNGLIVLDVYSSPDLLTEAADPCLQLLREVSVPVAIKD